VGSSEIGACVKLDAIAAPTVAPSVATSKPCCAAQDTASSRKYCFSLSVNDGAPDAAHALFEESPEDARGRRRPLGDVIERGSAAPTRFPPPHTRGATRGVLVLLQTRGDENNETLDWIPKQHADAIAWRGVALRSNRESNREASP
jgi:hypothetical protein